MNFKEVKDAVSLKDAAMFYGTEVKSSGMCRCPFHNDHNPSMKLYDRSYYCFGCGAHGDVIDFTGHLHGLAPMQAAEKLITDFGLNIPITRNLSPSEKKKRIQIANEALRKNKLRSAFSLTMRDLRQMLVSCRNKLNEWKHTLAPKNKDVDPHTWDRRFVRAHIWSSYVDYLIDEIDFGENYERFELFTHRKEVERFAAELMSDRCAAGHCGA